MKSNVRAHPTKKKKKKENTASKLCLVYNVHINMFDINRIIHDAEHRFTDIKRSIQTLRLRILKRVPLKYIYR